MADLQEHIKNKQSLKAFTELKTTKTSTPKEKVLAGIIYPEMGKYKECAKLISSIDAKNLEAKDIFPFHFMQARSSYIMTRFEDCSTSLKFILKQELKPEQPVSSLQLKASLLLILAQYDDAEDVLK